MSDADAISDILARLETEGALPEPQNMLVAPVFRDSLAEFAQELRFKGRKWALQPKGNPAFLREAERIERRTA